MFALRNGMPVAALVVYANIAMYACCYMAQTPVLPYLLKHIGADTSAYAKLQTVLSGVQTIGGLLSGFLMDKYGAKVMLVISAAASAAIYSMTAMATSMPLIYASSFPSLLQHANLAAKVWISKACGTDNRAAFLGYIGLAYSVGQVTGPYIGGQVSTHVGTRAPAYLATWGSVASALSLILLLPSGTAPNDKDSRNSSADLSSQGEDGKGEKAGVAATGKRATVADVVSLCVQRGIRGLMLMKFFASCAQGLLHATLPLILSHELQLTVAQSGYIMSYIGLISFFVHGFLINWLIKRFSEPAIVRYSCLGLFLSFIALAFCHSFTAIAVVMAPLTMFAHCFDIVNTALISKTVPVQQTGSVLAVEMCLGSVSSLASPLVGATLLQQHGVRGIGCACGVLLSAAVCLMYVEGAGAVDTSAVKKHA